MSRGDGDGVGLLVLGGTATVTRFSYDGDSLIAEYDANNALTRRYVHGAGSDAALVWYEGSGTTNRRWLLPDERGSIVALADDAGQSIMVNSYDDFGIPGYNNMGRFQYTGQAWLPELGIYHYKARMYSATLGRFLQTDPIGYGDGMNIYAYVGNDPVNGVDPSGNCRNNAESVNECGNFGRQNGIERGESGGAFLWRYMTTIVNQGDGYGMGGFDGAAVTAGMAFHSGVVGGYLQRLGSWRAVNKAIEQLAAAGNGVTNPNTLAILSIAYQGEYHDKVVKDLSAYLTSKGVPNVMEFSLCLTGTNSCIRADIFGKFPNGGGYFVNEVKTGKRPSFTPNQLIVYPHLWTGPITTYDTRSSRFGLTPGLNIGPITGYLYYKTDPNTKQVVVPF